MTHNEYFANYLYKCKKIDKKTFEMCLNLNENIKCLDYLIEKNLIDSNTKLMALSSYFDLPAVDLELITIMQNIEDYFSLEVMRKNLFIPIYVSPQNEMIIATPNPKNPQMVALIKACFSGKVEFVIVEEYKIVNFLNQYEANITTKDALNSIEKNVDEVKNPKGDELIVQNAPAVRFVDSIIKEAIPLRASDIHIEPGDEKVVVRYRIDGDLIKWTEFSIDSYQEVSARIKILANIDIAERRIPQDGRLTLNINGEDYNFRVSTLPTIYGEKFVIRILDNQLFSYDLNKLDFSNDAYTTIKEILKHHHGIILLTGPTGSGKTTTLYALLRELNDGRKNVVTIEDPVEYAMRGINQLQINPKANLTFASSLRSILRQDPDIIMVGEIRDEETAQIATRAAITGHIVLSTLHTNDAPGAVVRLIDMGIPEYLVCDALVAVISQRLVKRLCPQCKKKFKTNKSVMELLGLNEPKYIYKPCGCPFCNNTGYKGRIAVHEILKFDNKLKNQIMSDKSSYDNLGKLAKESGMISMVDACKKYVLMGITSIDEFSNIIIGQ